MFDLVACRGGLPPAGQAAAADGAPPQGLLQVGAAAAVAAAAAAVLYAAAALGQAGHGGLQQHRFKYWSSQVVQASRHPTAEQGRSIGMAACAYGSCLAAAAFVAQGLACLSQRPIFGKLSVDSWHPAKLGLAPARLNRLLTAGGAVALPARPPCLPANPPA